MLQRVLARGRSVDGVIRSTMPTPTHPRAKTPATVAITYVRREDAVTVLSAAPGYTIAMRMRSQVFTIRTPIITTVMCRHLIYLFIMHTSYGSCFELLGIWEERASVDPQSHQCSILMAEDTPLSLGASENLGIFFGLELVLPDYVHLAWLLVFPAVNRRFVAECLGISCMD